MSTSPNSTDSSSDVDEPAASLRQETSSLAAANAVTGQTGDDAVEVLNSPPILDYDQPMEVPTAGGGTRTEPSRLSNQLRIAARRFTVGGSSRDMMPSNYPASLQPDHGGDDTALPSASSSRRGSDDSVVEDHTAVSPHLKPRRASCDAVNIPSWTAKPSRRPSLDAALPGRSDAQMILTPATPERKLRRSVSVSPKRSSPIISSPIATFRSIFKHPQLSSIPASPMSPPPPPPAPGISRSQSSPPFLPSVPVVSPLSPVHLHFTPPSAEPEHKPSSWPSSTSSEDAYPFPLTAITSTPHLSISIPTRASMADSPLEDPLHGSAIDSEDETDQALENVFRADANENGRARHEKRYHALLELVETESAYLESLRILVQVYFQTLPFLVTLSRKEIEAVVRNADELLNLHSRIVTRLEQVELEIGWKRREGQQGDLMGCRRVCQAVGRVASIFVDELPNFALYNDFCARHTEAMDIVRNVAIRPEWEAYERQCGRLSNTQVAAGDQTPLATQAKSPFFASTPSLLSTSTPTLVGSPPLSPAVPDTPQSYEAPTRDRSSMPAGLGSRRDSAPASPSTRSRLRFADYAIAPVQRICRYPLVLGAVLKHMEDDDAEEKRLIRDARDGLKQVAENVDVAKNEREGELRTRIVAARMDFIAPTYSAFCDILGPTLLVGTMHFLHRSHAPESLRVKYYGCFLYRSHLVISKIKKRDSYEPREWLPLRLFEISNVEEGEGLLPHSIRLSHRDHVFELGAACEGEKLVWYNRLTVVQAEARQAWLDQEIDAHGQPTLFDDTIVSSVSAHPSPSHGVSNLPRRNHSRSNSAVSMTSVLERVHDELPVPVPESPIITSLPPLPVGGSAHYSTNRNRFSATANSLLGRTPAVQRAAIDLRLSDVLSEEILAARAQAMREADAGSRMTRHGSTSIRTRTLSGPKRSMTAQATASVKMLAKEKRRMSLFDPPTSTFAGLATDMPLLDPSLPNGHDAETAVVHREPPQRTWSTPLRKARSGGGSSHYGRSRPNLPEIDTQLAETMRKSGTWNAKAVRRAASHSSLTGQRATPVVTVAADVERNNSVSSTSSSSGTGTNSSSSHASQQHLVVGGVRTSSAYSNETPPSSIPPSPDCQPIDLDQLDAKFAAGLMHTASSPSVSMHGSRWNAQVLGDNVSAAFRIKRRGSSLGLRTAASSGNDGAGIGIGITSVPPQFTDEDLATRRAQSHLQTPGGSAGVHRRASTKLGGFFSKRVQSSPTLSNLFANAMNSPSHGSAGPGSVAHRRTALMSVSSPHLTLPLPANSPIHDPAGASPSVSDGGHSVDSPPSSGTSSPEHMIYASTSSSSGSRRGSTASSKGGDYSASTSAASSIVNVSTSSQQALHPAAPTYTSRNKSMRSLFRLTPIT